MGAKPVKNPMTKHKEKWTAARFHSWILFFDLSKEPISLFSLSNKIRRGEREGGGVGIVEDGGFIFGW